jgi:phosphate transport system permease protein
MLFAVPLGVGAAVFLSEIAGGTVRRLASFLIELLAAIPSVVYGFWGIVFLAKLFGDRVYPTLRIDSDGYGMFTCGLLLAIMVVPYVTAITFDVCRAVPVAQRQGALALGTTRWQMIWQVVLPYARPGIIGGCFLALGRALGETMAVAMLIGNNPRISANIFGPGYSIPAVMANQWGGANTDLYKAALVQLALVLLLVTVVVNSLARLMIWNMGRNRRGFSWWGRRPLPAPSVNGDPAAPAQASAPAAPRTAPLVSRLRNPRAPKVNSLMTVVLALCMLVIVVPLFHILTYITITGAGYVNLTFFTGNTAYAPNGLGHAMLGTLIMVVLATVGAVPLGILAALYLTEYPKSRINPTVRFVGELLGGVPSIVIGLFAYALVVVPMHQASALAGAFALGVMMVPIVMRASEESLKLVPSALRQASYALGASHWQTVYKVIVPAALPAVITGVFLAIARIAGETAPLLFTAGNSNYWQYDVTGRMPFLTYYIYTGATGEGGENMKNMAWGGAFVLLTFVMVLNVGIRALAGRRSVDASRAD